MVIRISNENLLQVVIGKRNEKVQGGFSDVVSQEIEPLGQEENETKPFKETIETLVRTYLRNIKIRDEKEAKEMIAAVKNNQKKETRKLRTPETEFQNSLLKVIYNKDIKTDDLRLQINRALSEQSGERSIPMQQEIDSILRGVNSCKEAAKSLEKETRETYPEKKIWIATNNLLDAQYKIDLLVLVENSNGSIEILELVQVKSNVDQEDINSITKKHREYINSLPHFIGILNKKEIASEKNTPTEKLSSEFDNIQQEKIILFGLVLDSYIEQYKDNPGNANAIEFYELLKKEAREQNTTFNPFTVINILKNTRRMDVYKEQNYFTGNITIENSLQKTANEIPYTKDESLEYYQKLHPHTVMNSAKTYSVIMQGSKKLSQEEIQ